MSVLFLFQPQTRSGRPLDQPSSLKTTGPLHWTPTPRAISWGGKTKAQDIWQLRRELTGLWKRKTEGGWERKCSPGKWPPSVSQGLLMVHTEKQRISLYIVPASSFRSDHFPASHPIPPPPPPLSRTPDTELPGLPKGQRQKGLTSLPSILACASWCLCFLGVPTLELNCVVQDSEFTKMFSPLSFQSGLKESVTSGEGRFLIKAPSLNQFLSTEGNPAIFPYQAHWIPVVSKSFQAIFTNPHKALSRQPNKMHFHRRWYLIRNFKQENLL